MKEELLFLDIDDASKTLDALKILSKTRDKPFFVMGEVKKPFIIGLKDTEGDYVNKSTAKEKGLDLIEYDLKGYATPKSLITYQTGDTVFAARLPRVRELDKYYGYIKVDEVLQNIGVDCWIDRDGRNDLINDSGKLSSVGYNTSDSDLAENMNILFVGGTFLHDSSQFADVLDVPASAFDGKKTSNVIERMGQSDEVANNTPYGEMVQAFREMFENHDSLSYLNVKEMQLTNEEKKMIEEENQKSRNRWTHSVILEGKT